MNGNERSIDIQNRGENRFGEKTYRETGVTTCFTPFERVITLPRVASSLPGIKHKSLLDRLLGGATVLNRLAVDAPALFTGTAKRCKRTYGVWRNSLTIRDTVAAEKSAPRDMLGKTSVQRQIEKDDRAGRLLDELAAGCKEIRRIVP